MGLKGEATKQLKRRFLLLKVEYQDRGEIQEQIVDDPNQ